MSQLFNSYVSQNVDVEAERKIASLLIPISNHTTLYHKAPVRCAAADAATSYNDIIDTINTTIYKNKQTILTS